MNQPVDQIRAKLMNQPVDQARSSLLWSTVLLTQSTEMFSLMHYLMSRPSELYSPVPHPQAGGRSCPEVVWTSGHWLLVRTHPGACFIINFKTLSPAPALPMSA